MARPGLLKRAHNIQKSNTPWYTGRGHCTQFTIRGLRYIKKHKKFKLKFFGSFKHNKDLFSRKIIF